MQQNTVERETISVVLERSTELRTMTGRRGVDKVNMRSQ